MTKYFLKFLEDNQIKEREDIHKKVLLDYQAFIAQEKNRRKRTNSVSFQNFKLQVAVNFCKFMFENDYIKGDPTRAVKYAKQPKLLPRNVPSKMKLKRCFCSRT